jgi:hypothetical protein
MSPYRHAHGCNWPTKHPDYRGIGSTGALVGVPTVLVYDPQRGTCLEPCACWQARAEVAARQEAAHGC